LSIVANAFEGEGQDVALGGFVNIAVEGFHPAGGAVFRQVDNIDTDNIVGSALGRQGGLQFRANVIWRNHFNVHRDSGFVHTLVSRAIMASV